MEMIAVETPSARVTKPQFGTELMAEKHRPSRLAPLKFTGACEAHSNSVLSFLIGEKCLKRQLMVFCAILDGSFHILHRLSWNFLRLGFVRHGCVTIDDEKTRHRAVSKLRPHLVAARKIQGRVRQSLIEVRSTN